MNTLKTISIRLKPGQDLKEELDALTVKNNLKAACVLTCVGSLTTAVLRFANQPTTSTLTGHFEIVSLTGTMSIHGSHYHISISDGEGRTYGAHLMEGCKVYTTAEIVVGILEDVEFLREMCPESGYPELVVHEED
jgi:uncharacterized protein